MTTIGQAAFEAYNKYRGGVNHLGKKTPEWDELPEEIRHAWEAGAQAVASRQAGYNFFLFQIHPTINGEKFPYVRLRVTDVPPTAAEFQESVKDGNIVAWSHFADLLRQCKSEIFEFDQWAQELGLELVVEEEDGTTYDYEGYTKDRKIDELQGELQDANERIAQLEAELED